MTYLGDHTARSDAVVHSNHSLVIGVLPSPQVVLVAHVVGPLVDHEAAALHPDGVAPVEVGVEVGTVAAALMGAPLEVSVFIKYDLRKSSRRTHAHTFTRMVSIFNTVLRTSSRAEIQNPQISGIIL